MEAKATFDGFVKILKEVLPPTLGFKRLRIRVPDVLLETGTEQFALDAVSGGISSLIDIAWQIYLYSLISAEFVVVIDEPEAHLHPELQRLILPNLMRAFPTAQFIVATHNPFVVGSVPDSNVYVLRYNEEGKVESLLLDQANKAGTSDDILREVLGLQSTAAIWVGSRLEEIIGRYAKAVLDEDSLTTLRRELASLGLEKYVPTTIAEVLEARDTDG